MAQRVALAAALATAAAWVVLDEPTVGLDPVAKQGLFSVLASVKRDGTGILIATHDAVFARALCDEAIVLKEGRCVCFGKMRQVIENREGKRVLFVRSDCDYRTEADPG